MSLQQGIANRKDNPKKDSVVKDGKVQHKFSTLVLKAQPIVVTLTKVIVLLNK